MTARDARISANYANTNGKVDLIISRIKEVSAAGGFNITLLLDFCGDIEYTTIQLKKLGYEVDNNSYSLFIKW